MTVAVRRKGRGRLPVITNSLFFQISAAIPGERYFEKRACNIRFWRCAMSIRASADATNETSHEPLSVANGKATLRADATAETAKMTTATLGPSSKRPRTESAKREANAAKSANAKIDALMMEREVLVSGDR